MCNDITVACIRFYITTYAYYSAMYCPIIISSMWPVWICVSVCSIGCVLDSNFKLTKVFIMESPITIMEDCDVTDVCTFVNYF